MQPAAAGAYVPAMGDAESPRLSRRRFVAALGAAAGGVMLRGWGVEPRALQVTRHAAGERRGPDHRPLTVAQVTDL
ncbi:MAG TPA: hypothetical protein VFQ45_23295, partial [Longimicrobium sp.]|nr:hypothetical protein [Longimicrobium sp.]